MSDFMPSFLHPGNKESKNHNEPVKPLVDIKRNSSSTQKSWYCNRIKDDVTNVFCNKTSSSEVVSSKNVVYESSPDDRSVMIDNSAQNDFAKPTVNSDAFQSPQAKSVIQNSQPNFSVPIQPSKNVNMNINQQQIQINIKY